MSQLYQALLLAAGEGTRLRPLTDTTPKCLVPVLGVPLLRYWLELLHQGPSPSTVWINTSYLAGKVEVFLDEHKDFYPGLKIVSTYEPKLLGTGGTLRHLAARFNAAHDLLLIHADNLSWFNLSSFLIAHASRPPQTEITMLTFDSDDPQSCGIVEVDSDRVVVAFHEKVQRPPSNLANGAVYLVSPAGLSRIKKLSSADDFSKDVIPSFIGKIFTWHNSTYHRDIGTPDSYTLGQIEFHRIASSLRLTL